MKIAVILPIGKSDYLANTVLDGLLELKEIDNSISFVTTKNYPNPFDLSLYEKEEIDFINFAEIADLIILAWGKNSTNFFLAERINQWQKTVFLDGSELGKDKKYDPNILQDLIDLKYEGTGAINRDMLSKCRVYFRREKPYLEGIVPFLFGIERRYRKYNIGNQKRDIDFTCIFGQDEYPILRRQAKEYLEEFCKKNNFICCTKRTKGFDFDDHTKNAGRDMFYEILSRTKVGISISGGGFDTARFWEILASGAILFTEKIDLSKKEQDRLNFKRIFQFNNLIDFKEKLESLGKYLKNDYLNDLSKLNLEYEKVIEIHSSANRVRELINTFNHTNEQ